MSEENAEVVEPRVFTVRGVIPTPKYFTGAAVFGHDRTTAPSPQQKRPFYNADEPAHVVSVTTDNEKVATMLAEIFAKVYSDVTVT